MPSITDWIQIDYSHELHNVPVANLEASPFWQPSLGREIAAEALALSEKIAQRGNPHPPPFRTDDSQMSHQPMPSTSPAEQDIPQPAAKETGDMHLFEDSYDEGPATNMTPAAEENLEDTSSTFPSLEAPQLSSKDLTKLIAEKAPELLANIDTIKELFQETYAKKTQAPKEKADRSNGQQQLTSQAQRRRPSVEGNTRSPAHRPKQTASASGHFSEKADHSSPYSTALQTQKQRPAVGGSMRSPSYPPRRRQLAPASGHSVSRLPKEVLPPVDSSETESEYYTESDDEDDDDMTESDAPLEEIVVRTRARQSEMDKEPDAKRAKLDAAKPSMGQNLGSAPAPSPPSARQDTLDLLDDPNLPSEVYKTRLLEFLVNLKEDEEKLQHIKDDEEARNKELQILLLRTDIEKQRVLLNAQLAYEEATDGEEQVVLNLTHPSLTPGSDGCYGVLPRPSAFMLKTLLKLGDELEVLKAELEGKNGEEDSGGMADKTLRVENLRFFIDEFMGYYNADLEKEKEVRRQRDELERQEASSAGRSAAQPFKTNPPVRYPTQMIHDHDNPKAHPPLDTRIQPWRPVQASRAVPSPPPQPLEDNDASARDNSGRRRPRLVHRSFYDTGLDVIEEGMPSESDVSMYAEEGT